MNRQAITFFSLFSLILVLSVYYMMIPPIDNNKNINQDMEISLQEKLNAKRENDIQIQNDILASSASSSEQLNEALGKTDLVGQGVVIQLIDKAGTQLSEDVSVESIREEDLLLIININITTNTINVK